MKLSIYNKSKGKRAKAFTMKNKYIYTTQYIIILKAPSWIQWPGMFSLMHKHPIEITKQHISLRAHPTAA